VLLFARECHFLIDSALVLNGIVTVANATEMALSLHRLTGSESRHRHREGSSPTMRRSQP
jgi:hypothetical protein